MNRAQLFPAFEQEAPVLIAPANQMQRLRAIEGNYIANFINEHEEQFLLDKIATESWINDLQRRVQHYGYRYDYKTREINHKDYIGALPAWVDSIIDRFMQEGIFKEKPDQMIVNEYQPGQGIAPHTDRNCFGPTLASLSLGSACVMSLKHVKGENFDIILEPRSLVIYNGTSRSDWKHGIAARQSDKVDGITYPRRLRISLTFRTVLLKRLQSATIT